MLIRTLALQGFVPSHIQADVHAYYARTGDTLAAQQALQTLAESRALHSHRQAELRPADLAEIGDDAAEGDEDDLRDLRPGVMDRFTNDCKNTTVLPGLRLIREGEVPEEVTSDRIAINVHHEALKLHEHLQTLFERNSLDNQGKDILQVVNYGRDYNNAANTGKLSFYGNGDGKIFKDFGLDTDVIVHELWHEITSHNAGAARLGFNRGAGQLFDSIRYGGLTYLGQSGAANESWSDVMAKVYLWEKLSLEAGRPLTYDELPKDFWRLGAICMVGNNIDGSKSSIRHFEDQPGYDREDIGRDRQPKHMSNYFPGSADNYGVHINSGILNRAFQIACQTYQGYAPAKLGLVYYFGEQILHDRVSFKEIVTALLTTADQLFPGDANLRQALETGFAGVGLLGPASIEFDEIYELASNGRVIIFEDVDLKESPAGRYFPSREEGGSVWTIGRPVKRGPYKAARDAMRASLKDLKSLPGFERASVGLKNGKLVILAYVQEETTALPWPNSLRGHEIVRVVSDGVNGFVPA